jgi:hypothetical protein
VATASVPNTFASAVTATGLQLDTNYNTIVAYLNEPLNRNNYAADSGNTNTIVLTFSPAVSAYSAGLEITFKAANTNSGAAVINANSLGRNLQGRLRRHELRLHRAERAGGVAG